MFPGFQSPAAGFEAPFEMLGACHERVERTLDLLERLQRHVQTHGCDAQASQAATDVMRYFDMAAPLHHQDEELHVFPAILSGTDAPAARLVRQLIAQHRQMELLWAQMREVLSGLIDNADLPPLPFQGLDASKVAEFTAVYREHIRLEESNAYPAAQAVLGDDHLHAMGADMMRRRGVKPPALGRER